MRRRPAAAWLWVSLALGCARGVAPSEPTPAERVMAAELEDVSYRGRLVARAGEVVLERTSAGSVMASARGSDRVARPTAREDDLAIEASIRGRFSLDPLLAAMRVDVDVDRGVVKLSGHLESRDQAARALAISLSTGGVHAVESRLTWVVARERRTILGGARRTSRAP